MGLLGNACHHRQTRSYPLSPFRTCGLVYSPARGCRARFYLLRDRLVVPPSLVTPNWLFRLSDLFHLMDVDVFIVFMWKGIAEMFRDF
jgi:hypothetical protein